MNKKLICKFDKLECHLINPHEAEFIHVICDVCVKHKIKNAIEVLGARIN